MEGIMFNCIHCEEEYDTRTGAEDCCAVYECEVCAEEYDNEIDADECCELCCPHCGEEHDTASDRDWCRCGEEEEDPDDAKPVCQLTGGSGNVYAIIASVKTALRRAGKGDEANEFVKKATSSDSYGAVLSLAGDYCRIR
jgi:hypothetical protein